MYHSTWQVEHVRNVPSEYKNYPFCIMYKQNNLASEVIKLIPSYGSALA